MLAHRQKTIIPLFRLVHREDALQTKFPPLLKSKHHNLSRHPALKLLRRAVGGHPLQQGGSVACVNQQLAVLRVNEVLSDGMLYHTQ